MQNQTVTQRFDAETVKSARYPAELLTYRRTPRRLCSFTSAIEMALPLCLLSRLQSYSLKGVISAAGKDGGGPRQDDNAKRGLDNSILPFDQTALQPMR